MDTAVACVVLAAVAVAIWIVHRRNRNERQEHRDLQKHARGLSNQRERTLGPRSREEPFQ